jgi:hypothetical protein
MVAFCYCLFRFKIIIYFFLSLRHLRWRCKNIFLHVKARGPGWQPRPPGGITAQLQGKCSGVIVRQDTTALTPLAPHKVRQSARPVNPCSNPRTSIKVRARAPPRRRGRAPPPPRRRGGGGGGGAGGACGARGVCWWSVKWSRVYCCSMFSISLII